MPQISIITITYNAEAFLERTIRSIRSQTSQDFEYLLLDGGSKDGTMAIVNANADIFDYIISEKDNGIYDAMNKGFQRATGDYVWFMNAGDEIAESNVVKQLNSIIQSGKPDIIYSDTLMVDNEGNNLGLRSDILPHKVPEKLVWQGYKMGMLICHQSFIVRRDLAPKYIENNLSADIDWEIKCLKKTKNAYKFPGIISKYLEGGTSNQRLFKSWKDRFLVLQSHFGFLPNLWNHFRIILRADILNIFRISKYIK
jgi:glycosyltransferase involved in cell wall biosynthesis